MTISMYSASVPVFVRMLGNLLTWLDKAEAHAAAKKFDTSVLLVARDLGFVGEGFGDRVEPMKQAMAMRC